MFCTLIFFNNLQCFVFLTLFSESWERVELDGIRHDPKTTRLGKRKKVSGFNSQYDTQNLFLCLFCVLYRHPD